MFSYSIYAFILEGKERFYICLEMCRPLITLQQLNFGKKVTSLKSRL